MASEEKSLTKIDAPLNELIFSTLPQTSVSLIFAYGSGALPQVGRDISKGMIDFVVAVDDSKRWHAENLRRNPRHYSFMRFFGASRVADYQTRYPAYVYCNTLVPTEGERYMKYGVIETRQLIADLLDWENLYISGRLHKPVHFVYGPTASKKSGDRKAVLQSEDDSPATILSSALRTNLDCACHAALLLSPEQLTWEEFCIRLASLSYNGDFRQIVGEDKNKVANIVRANIEKFEKLYVPILSKMDKQVSVHTVSRRITQDLSAPAVHHHLEMLPRRVQWNLQTDWNRDGKLRDIEEVIFQLAYTFDFPQRVDKAIRRIVFRSSVQQTAKNVLSAGLKKTIVYSLAKLVKMMKSLR